jgi:hypothetical protein
MTCNSQLNALRSGNKKQVEFVRLLAGTPLTVVRIELPDPVPRRTE